VKLTNSVRSMPLVTREGRDVRGLVRVRGIDARVKGRGITLESHEPLAVLVSGEQGVTRVALPVERSLALAYAAAPIAYLCIRVLTRKGK
jgi:hypothetical protein